MRKYSPEELIHKYVQGTCTPEEKALVESWHLQELAESTPQLSEEQVTAVHERMRAALARHLHKAQNPPLVHRPWFRMAAAAILLFIIAGVYFLLHSRPAEIAGATRQSVQEDIAPGHNGAILTLADGSHIVLDSAANGVIARQHDANITLKDGQLTYEAKASAAVYYNTISTPKGRQFQLVLSDGTKVWLNAASSLRYPISFTGSERNVEVTGEAYFEVVKNKRMPFKVKINEQTTVEVLGTSFNINAYTDESAVRTTLLEGSVKVSQSAGESVVLKPGEQAVATRPSPAEASAKARLATNHSPSIDKVMAWKNGVFNFQDATLQEVMRQLARWYDIEVVYEQKPPAIEFEGEMNRQNTLKEVLGSLEKLGVHFRLEQGRRVVVLPS